jgi:hypothetical protein
MIRIKLRMNSYTTISSSLLRLYASKVRKVCNLCLCISFLLACSLPPDTKLGQISDSSPTNSDRVGSLEGTPSSAELEALNSLVKVDPYPLFVMRYSPDHSKASTLDSHEVAIFPSRERRTVITNDWSCSLVSVINDENAHLFGRNFDWRYSPALLLFYQPADGFGSVAMVDLEYFFDNKEIQQLDELALIDRMPLLETYRMPFDGMNSQGLVIGMAAVPFSDLPSDPELETVDSLAIMRRILDQASDVDSALHILSSITPNWGRGPALHYMISDSNGRSVLVEYLDGEMILLEAPGTWHIATNFLQHSVDLPQAGQCWRYDQLHEALQNQSDGISMEQLMALLASVSQDGEGSSTQWSIVYNFSQGDIEVVVGQEYTNPYRFHLPITNPWSN